jgi:hypothetical protein
MLSTSAPLIAVIDGDLQHDESLLPRMRDTLKQVLAEQDLAKPYFARHAGHVQPASGPVQSPACGFSTI